MSVNIGQIRTVECCMILFRTANVPVGPEVEARGAALVLQKPSGGGVLVSAIGLPNPAVLGGSRYIAWIRGTPSGQVIPFPLLQTGPVVTEPGVWVGAFVISPGEIIAPFRDIIVTAETEQPVITPNLSRIALIGNFTQCRP